MVTDGPTDIAIYRAAITAKKCEDGTSRQKREDKTCWNSPAAFSLRS